MVEMAVPVVPLVVDAALNTTTAASHGVFAPVPTVAVAVEPLATGLSSTSSAMSPVEDTLARWVSPAPGVNVLLNPDSA
jgi:hypothetical protein